MKQPKVPPCKDCGSTRRPRSACPGCGVVVCQLCAEREGEFCCDGVPAALAADVPGEGK